MIKILRLTSHLQIFEVASNLHQLEHLIRWFYDLAKLSSTGFGCFVGKGRCLTFI